MSEKSGGDFRYSVGESKVPWHAVGEFYDGKDSVEMVKFLLPDDGKVEHGRAKKTFCARKTVFLPAEGKAEHGRA